jgi:hypothetical protein
MPTRLFFLRKKRFLDSEFVQCSDPGPGVLGSVPEYR